MGASMLLTVALRASATPQLHYQLPQIVQSVDWINLMSYDYVSLQSTDPSTDCICEQTAVHGSVAHTSCYVCLMP